MKKYIIFMAMAMMLYVISGYGQLSGSVAVPAHVMMCSSWDQTGPSIAIDKNNAPNLLCSFGTVYHGDECGASNYQGYWFENGAAQCQTSCTYPSCTSCPICNGQTTSLPMPNSSTDSRGYPSTTFDAAGTGYLMGRNYGENGFFFMTTPDDGTSWSSTVDITETADRQCFNPMIAADDLGDPANTFMNNCYAIWQDGYYGHIYATTKPAGAGAFNTANLQLDDMSEPSSVVYNAGPCIVTGPNPSALNVGAVYACWSEENEVNPGVSGGSPDVQGAFIGFSVSNDGGASYTNVSDINPILYNGIPGTMHSTYVTPDAGDLVEPNSTYGNSFVNSYPSMAVDKSCITGGHRGRVYIVAAEQHYGGASNISLWFSDDQGSTWTGGVYYPSVQAISASGTAPVNVSGATAPDHCWMPAVAVDDMTGVVSVVYYGFSGSAANTNTYVSFCDPNSTAGLSSWQTIQVSANTQTPMDFLTHPCGTGSYLDKRNPLEFSQCNAIASYNGHAYPVWQDRGSGLRQIWIADVAYSGVTPVASSAEGQQICPPASPTSTPSAPFIQSTESFDAATFIDVATCGNGGGLSIGSSTIPATVSMKASQFIQIGPGFVTAPGSVFTAEIGPNDGCQTPGVHSFSHEPPHASSSDNSVTSTSINGIKVYAYPNPTANLVTVGASNNNYQNVSFSVTDISGRLLAQYNNPTVSGSDIKQTIDASAYAPGLYIVTMIADNKKYSFKIAKE